MIHNIYYRLLAMLVIGAFSCLLLPEKVQAQANNNNPNWNTSWDWTCNGCNDNNPCTIDLCFFGQCFNLPLRNCGNDEQCEIKIAQVQVGQCYVDPADNKSKAKLKVCVWWREAPNNKDIRVWINGQEKFIDVERNRDGECVEFIIPANGTNNNKVWAQFKDSDGCKDEKTYKSPVACEPAPNCDLEISKVKVGECYYDEASGKSKAQLEVCVKWKNRPPNEKIMVSINGDTKWVTPGNGNAGSECVTFTVLANGSAHNGIWAKFERTDECQDEAHYDTPAPCVPANCELDITSVSVSDCYFDHNDYKSKAKLTICVKWKNRPANENIMVSIEGQTKTIQVNAASGTQCVEFIIPANGTTFNGIWAKFQRSANCQDESKYHSPSPCVPANCELDITSVNVSECYFDHNDYKSKAKVKICVKWKNRPANDKIMVSISGQSQTITPSESSGSTCVEFVVPANGTFNNGIWVKFLSNPNCQDEGKYNTPQPCQPLPECDLDITSVNVSSCYFDHNDYKSKAKLTICVKWSNRPSNENIMVSINGQTKTINVNASNGSACVEFIILANGAQNQGIWAKFQNTSNCQDEDKYTAPQPCQPLPECDLDITSVSVSSCYFDHNDYKSKAKLTICVKWNNRPGNENIIVSIGGQSQTIATSTSSGSKCVEFIIPANGAQNQGIWAKFQYTTNCQDEDKYTAPQPCQPLPQCDLDITSVSVSNCYFDHNDYKSKAKLTICVKWTNRPNNENIMVSINGQTKTINVNASNGSACVEFIILANGVQNQGIWAKFQNTANCQDEDKYHAPSDCQPLPECDLDITSVSVSNCYFDHGDYRSKAKLTVCVKWTNRPGNENIIVSINGQTKTINTNASNGSACVEFIIPANGAQHQGIWAKFQNTTNCQDEDKYHAPSDCQPLPECDLDIIHVDVSECYYDDCDGKSKATVSVCVKWTNRPGNENIIVSTGGQTQTIVPTSASGIQCVEFVVPANGAQNQGIWAKFQSTTACQDEDKYNAPQGCQPLPECELDIIHVDVTNCYYELNGAQSKAKLTVCVKWKNRPTNDKIVVSISGQSQTITPNSNSGVQCVEFVIPANGAQNQGIWAKFQNASSCQDEDKYTAPQSCQPLPECDLDITSVTVSECYFDHNDYQSKAKLKVCVKWENRPGTENILVSINGQTKTINTNAANGSDCVEFIIPANGVQNQGIWVKFQNNAACQDEAKYRAPVACQPQCDLDITSVSVSDCYFDHNDYQSKAKLKVCVKWTDRPANDKIVVSINGQSKTITPNSASGSECVEFIIPANGVQNQGIWAKFQNTPACQDEAKYRAPVACQPQCDLDITSVSVSSCYFDHSDYQSKAKLKICVKWTNRPGNEYIVINISNQYKIITPSSANGSECVEFVIPANGIQNQGIWAKFQYATQCQDEAKYSAPFACQPLPECDLDITSVSVSNCYFDHYDYQSKAKLTVCVKWTSRPNNENIMVSINGQTKTINTNASNGSACVEFIVPANGSSNNGIWAKFQNTPACQDEAKYNLPYPCNETRECELDITGVSVSNCYFDHYDYRSKATLKVCLKWNNAPAGEKIKVLINGQGKLIAFNASSGSVCVEFTIPANGVQNEGIWAKFENTIECSDEAYYNAPRPCQPSGLATDNPQVPINAALPDKAPAAPATTDDTEGVTIETLPAEVLEVEKAPVQLRVFPNPTRNELNVDLTPFAGKAATIQVFNALGKVMYETKLDEVNTEKLQLDVRQYANEMYLIKVQVPGEGIFTHKFIVSK